VPVDEGAFDEHSNDLTPNAAQPTGVAIGGLLAPALPIGGEYEIRWAASVC
jgi:hypothetical protein